MHSIKYQCKSCGWETSIREEWGDLKPKRCMNRKCNTSFAANPDALVVTRPEPREIDPVVLDEQKDKRDGKANRKSQKSS